MREPPNGLVGRHAVDARPEPVRVVPAVAVCVRGAAVRVLAIMITVAMTAARAGNAAGATARVGA